MGSTRVGRVLSLACASLFLAWVGGCKCPPSGKPEVAMHGMFRQAAYGFPSAAQLDLRSSSGGSEKVLVVHVFATKSDPSKVQDPENHLDTLVGPEPSWRLVSRRAVWSPGQPLSALVRVTTRCPDGTVNVETRRADVQSPAAAVPRAFQADAVPAPGDQITSAQASGTFYSSGVALYDVSVTYDSVPRAIRVYAAPEGSQGFPNASHLIHIETGLPSPPGGTATWTGYGLSGSYDGSSTTYWMAFEAVHNAGSFFYTGNFTNIQPVDPIQLDPLP